MQCRGVSGSLHLNEGARPTVLTTVAWHYSLVPQLCPLAAFLLTTYWSLEETGPKATAVPHLTPDQPSPLGCHVQLYECN